MLNTNVSAMVKDTPSSASPSLVTVAETWMSSSRIRRRNNARWNATGAISSAALSVAAVTATRYSTVCSLPRISNRDWNGRVNSSPARICTPL